MDIQSISSFFTATLTDIGYAELPYFGVLEIKHRPARLIKNEKIDFIPPQSVVTFTYNENVNAIETIAHMAKKGQVDESIITIELKKITDSLKQVLADGNDFYLENIGTFHPDGTFESTRTTETCSNAYGLASFSIDKVTDAEQKEKKERPVKLIKNTAKTIVFAAPILFSALLIPNILQISHNAQFASLFRNTTVYTDYTQPERPRPQDFTPSKLAINNTPSQTDTTAPQKAVKKAKTTAPTQAQKQAVKKNVQSSTTSKGSSKQQAIKKSTTKPNAIKKSAKKQSVKKAKTSAQTENAKYFIIVGTFAKRANAERYSKQLKNKDYDSGIINENEKSRVYLSAFADKSEAQQYINDLHNRSEYSNAWLYVKES